jgi:SAM-dependent methyltransferase
MKQLVKYECSVCGSNRFKTLRHIRLKREKTPVSVCTNCGVICLNPRMSEQDYARYYASQYYGEYQAHPVSVPDTDNTTAAQIRAAEISDDLGPWLNKSTKILEIGCGPGPNLIELKRRGNDDLTGLEPSLECCEIVRSNGIRCVNGVLSDIDRSSAELGNADLVILSHMLEHFVDPANSLKQISDLLSDDGLLYILVPNVYENDYRRQFTTPHTFYFSTETLDRILRKSGFMTQQVFTGRPREMAVLARKQGAPTTCPVDDAEYLRAIDFLQIGQLKTNVIYVSAWLEWSLSILAKSVFPAVAYRFIRDQYRKRIN